MGAIARELAFQLGDISMEIEVTEERVGLRVVGQLVPPQPAMVRAEQSVGAIDTTADELGRFTLDPLSAGPVRFVVTRADFSFRRATQWTRI